MQNKSVAQNLTDFAIRVEHRAEETAIGTAIFVGQVAEQAKRQNWFMLALGGRFGVVEIGVPKKPRGVAITLSADLIEGRREPLPCRIIAFGRRRPVFLLLGRCSGSSAMLRNRLDMNCEKRLQALRTAKSELRNRLLRQLRICGNGFLSQCRKSV